MTRDHRVTHHDALSEFASEPVPPPATSELDALIDAASAGALAAFPSEAVDLPAAARTTVNARWRWSLGVSLQPVTVRWVAAPAAAFVVGAVLVAWGLRALEPNAPTIARATPPIAVVETTTASNVVTPPIAPAVTRPEPLPAPAPVQPPPPVFETEVAVATPAPEPPRPIVAAAETVTAVRVPSAVPPAAPATSQPAVTASARATIAAPVRQAPPPAVREPAPAPVRAAAPAPVRDTSPTTVRAAAPAAVPPARNTRPASAPASVLPAPAAASFDARAVLPSAIAEPPPIPPAAKPVELAAAETTRPALVAAPIAAAVVEERAVRETLEHYADAFAEMDVRATAVVWPSVDRRALTRAFATLKSQGLTFDSCNINVRDQNATAHCRGTVKFVRKIGNPTPLTAPQQWRFVMRKLGTTWTIDEVAATADEMTAAHARTES